MAEIAIGMYSRQCLGKTRIPDMHTLKKKTQRWEEYITEKGLTINWSFYQICCQRENGVHRVKKLNGQSTQVGQKSENDGNKNTTYPKLEKKIKETYVAKSSASAKNALYDSYVKAIRWATDRMGEGGGIIGFITNASFLDSISCDGLRKSFGRRV